MSMGLDLIKRQQQEIIDGFPTGNIFIGVTKEELTELEKELNALQILKNKQVDIELFMNCDKWEEYVVRCENHADMSKPVYDLLKEVLK